MEWIYLVVGAVVGTVFSIFGQSAWDRARIRERVRTARIRRRIAHLEDGSIYGWLKSYYISRGAESDLYRCRIGAVVETIPFLTTPMLVGEITDLSAFSKQFVYDGPSEEAFPIDKRMVHRRESLGQVLFDEPTIFLHAIQIDCGTPKVISKSCRYLEMFSLLAMLEEETHRASTISRKCRTPARDRILPDLGTALDTRNRPRSIGCQVALAFRTARSWEVLLQVRSHSTITFGGASAVIPVFGLSPMSESDSSNLLLHNIVKEYCEELFDYEELIRTASSRRASPLWFLTLPEAREFLAALQERELAVEFTGMGFDGLNASLTLSFSVLVQDRALADDLKERMRANWEVASHDEVCTPLEFIDIDNPRLGELLKQGAYHVGSAFCISRLLGLLDRR